MTSDKARKAAIRARMASTGEPYSVAARTMHDQAPSAAATIDRQLLVPYPDEDGVTVEELGWRVLPADATPAQRARAEAVWRPVTSERPCRCSGPCHHGQKCGNGPDGIDSCTGFLQHYDRRPGSFFESTCWIDDYLCPACGEAFETSVTLSELPWAELRTNPNGGTTTVIFPGVRHPNFPEVDDDDDVDDGCPDCWGESGDGRCVCDECGGCPECGAGSKGDPYGECVCYTE